MSPLDTYFTEAQSAVPDAAEIPEKKVGPLAALKMIFQDIRLLLFSFDHKQHQARQRFITALHQHASSAPAKQQRNIYDISQKETRAQLSIQQIKAALNQVQESEEYWFFYHRKDQVSQDIFQRVQTILEKTPLTIQDLTNSILEELQKASTPSDFAVVSILVEIDKKLALHFPYLSSNFYTYY